MVRRTKVIKYQSTFLLIGVIDPDKNIYRADPNLRIEVTRWKMDFMLMLIDAYNNLGQYWIPKIIEEASNEYMEENNDFIDYIDEYLEHTGSDTDYVQFKELKKHFY